MSGGRGQRGDPPAGTSPNAEPGVRLQKWLAEAGLCSRREGERWILEGRVAIDGQVVTQLGTRVLPGQSVAVNGQPVVRERLTRLVVLLHKPVGVLCTRHDPEGRRTVFDLLGKGAPRLVLVGRLDYNSEGALLLTNDGLLAYRLMRPVNRVPRVYKVKVHGNLTEATLAQLARGVTLEDGPTGPIDFTVDRLGDSSNAWLTLTLHEGRNRLVRRLFAHLGLEVARLLRIAFGGVELGELNPGQWRILEAAEVDHLRRSVGFVLASDRHPGPPTRDPVRPPSSRRPGAVRRRGG